MDSWEREIEPLYKDKIIKQERDVIRDLTLYKSVVCTCVKDGRCPY